MSKFYKTLETLLEGSYPSVIRDITGEDFYNIVLKKYSTIDPSDITFVLPPKSNGGMGVMVSVEYVDDVEEEDEVYDIVLQYEGKYYKVGEYDGINRKGVLSNRTVEVNY